MKSIQLLILGLLSLGIQAQMTSISYETNGLDSLTANNPFKHFIGEWTLKDNEWTQNWGGETETIKIPNHHTVAMVINTKNSLFQIIDGPRPNGHIFWSFNPVTKVVNHLSSFGELRAGVGEGTISEKGDVTLKISFEGEPENTYRIYNYKWLCKDEYQMKSVQYGSDGQLTGLFYEGTFVRLSTKPDIKSQIATILSVLDNNQISVEEQLEVYHDDVVHMAPGNEAIIGKAALKRYLEEQRRYGTAKMKHQIVEIEPLDQIVLMRGEVIGTFFPKNEKPPVDFRTKNMFVFDAAEGRLKIKKVIYNASPIE
jgi:hypothetical protein